MQLDNRSQSQIILAQNDIISTDTTTLGSIIDTADFDKGITFALSSSLHSAGTFTLLIEEGDDSGLSDASVVSGDQLIGTLPALTDVTAELDVLPDVGVISHKRFLRTSIVSTGASGANTIAVLAVEGVEIAPK